jgi:hypothetical protein
MNRFVVLALFTLIGLDPTRATAQPTPGGLQVVDAKIDGGEFQWDATELVPVVQEVAVEKEVNGMKVVQKQKVIVYETRTVTRAAEVKTLKATDARGKAIDTEKLAELLKDKAPVVLVSGAVPEKHRALFKDKTVFIELPAPKAPGAAPAAVPPPR